MKFFSLEDSKKLAEMGCKSESGWHYFPDLIHELEPSYKSFYDFKIVCAFQPQIDFLADTEQARLNCEILWGEEREIIGYYFVGYDSHLSDSPEDVIGLEQFNNIPDDEKSMYSPVYKHKGWRINRMLMLSSPDHIEFVRGFLR